MRALKVLLYQPAAMLHQGPALPQGGRAAGIRRLHSHQGVAQVRPPLDLLLQTF